MNPNANLQEQEEIHTGTWENWKKNRERLYELRRDLSDWLHAGNYEPDWHKCPVAAKDFPLKNGVRRAKWRR